jgi:propanol-preferring alcohol dehydrogenase
MLAMVLKQQGTPLEPRELPDPAVGRDEVLLDVATCGICRTDLHVLDGELNDPALPLVLGHQVVGRVVALGEDVERLSIGQRVGVPWLGWACGICKYCRQGRENLCVAARFTGYQIQGGYAQRTAAHAAFCLALPDAYGDAEVAPLLCAGLIGYRALVMAGDAQRLGLYGIGSAAHIIAQVAVHQGRSVYAFTRSGDVASQAFARSLGAVWAGGSDQAAPEPLDAALIFAPVGALVPKALADLDRGGRLICAGIHMSAIPSFDYSLLWQERRIQSVANLTRRDGAEFMALAARVPLEVSVQRYPLDQARRALDDLRNGRVTGAAVLVA